MKLILGALSILLLTSTAFAADLIVDEVALAPAPAASSVRGVIELGALANYVDETDEDFSGTAGGAYVSGAIWAAPMASSGGLTATSTATVSMGPTLPTPRHSLACMPVSVVTAITPAFSGRQA